jgi:hypothetical protein
VVAPPAAALAATLAGVTASSTHRTRRPGWLVALAITGTIAVIVALGALVLAGRGRTQMAVAAADSDGRVPALACASSFKACEGQCVSIDRPDHGCGADACHACNVSNATARCNQQHRCDIAVCYQDYDDCDGDSSNGCETNVRIDPDHCGACGRKCPALPHAQRAARRLHDLALQQRFPGLRRGSTTAAGSASSPIHELRRAAHLESQRCRNARETPHCKPPDCS